MKLFKQIKINRIHGIGTLIETPIHLNFHLSTDILFCLSYRIKNLNISFNEPSHTVFRAILHVYQLDFIFIHVFFSFQSFPFKIDNKQKVVSVVTLRYNLFSLLNFNLCELLYNHLKLSSICLFNFVWRKKVKRKYNNNKHCFYLFVQEFRFSIWFHICISTYFEMRKKIEKTIRSNSVIIKLKKIIIVRSKQLSDIFSMTFICHWAAFYCQ